LRNANGNLWICTKDGRPGCQILSSKTGEFNIAAKNFIGRREPDAALAYIGRRILVAEQSARQVLIYTGNADWYFRKAEAAHLFWHAENGTPEILLCPVA